MNQSAKNHFFLFCLHTSCMCQVHKVVFAKLGAVRDGSTDRRWRSQAVSWRKFSVLWKLGGEGSIPSVGGRGELCGSLGMSAKPPKECVRCRAGGKACQGEAISNAGGKDGFGARLKHRVTGGDCGWVNGGAGPGASWA